MTAISATDTGVPAGARERLSLFAEWTGTTPPAAILDGDSFAADFLRYAATTGLSLDWVWLADERSLVMQAHNATRGGRA